MGVRACVVFRDGTEKGFLLPDELAEANEITTARSDSLENITAHFERLTPRGVLVFREVEDRLNATCGKADCHGHFRQTDDLEGSLRCSVCRAETKRWS